MPRAHFLEPLLKKNAGPQTLVIVRSTGDVVLASTVEVAADSASRNRGLLGRDGLADDHALVIAPSSGIHTFGMQFAIDVIFVARDGRVVKVAPEVAASRIRVSIGAFAAIEMRAGSALRAQLEEGERLVVA